MLTSSIGKKIGFGKTLKILAPNTSLWASNTSFISIFLWGASNTGGLLIWDGLLIGGGV